MPSAFRMGVPGSHIGSALSQKENRKHSMVTAATGLCIWDAFRKGRPSSRMCVGQAVPGLHRALSKKVGGLLIAQITNKYFRGHLGPDLTKITLN